MSLTLNQPNQTLQFGSHEFNFSTKTYLMGVLNVTPDSFSDGGLFFDKENAVQRALAMEADGADVIDIGGESTRPGAGAVSVDEELRRVLPVIEALAPRLRIPLSIDTSKPEVARAAIKAGASMINNIMGTPLTRAMAHVVADCDVPLIIMHIRGIPGTMQKDPVYDDVVRDIMAALRESMAVAQECHVDPEKIIIDPGIGFGKTAEHNIEILKRLREFKALQRPLLVGPSRKAFLGSVLGIDNPKKRLMGTAAAVAAAIMNGADMVRVHDVKELSQLCTVVDKIFKS